ncbi:MAG: PilZ domain-containing protein [Candidatus Eremiobacteraeota bacterium]|nr:PilZ domain-containing protein [Candidatus Eremiobacteraeota bacterium]
MGLLGFMKKWLGEPPEQVPSRRTKILEDSGLSKGRSLRSRYFAEKRRFSRYAHCQEIFCYPMTSLPMRAMVLDASLGGLRLKTAENIEVNSNVGITLEIKGHMAQFLVKVLWESKSSDSYQYGVCFEKTEHNNNRELVNYIALLKGAPAS